MTWTTKAGRILAFLEGNHNFSGASEEIAKKTGMTPKEVGFIMGAFERLRVARREKGARRATAEWVVDFKVNWNSPPKDVNPEGDG